MRDFNKKVACQFNQQSFSEFLESFAKSAYKKLITGLCKHNLNAWNMFAKAEDQV